MARSKEEIIAEFNNHSPSVKALLVDLLDACIQEARVSNDTARNELGEVDRNQGKIELCHSLKFKLGDKKTNG